MKRLSLLSIGLMLMACMASPDTRLNKSIHVPNDEIRKNGLTTVNGSISVGARARIRGGCVTVNGKIEIGQKAEVENVSTVNGSIDIGAEVKANNVSTVNGSIEILQDAEIDGHLGTVNGSIDCHANVFVHDGISTINGAIELDYTKVNGDLTTVNGDVSLFNQSAVRGDIIIDRNNKGKSGKSHKKLFIRIGSDSIVKGNIEVLGIEPNVTVILSDGGKVKGEIINAEVIHK